MKPILITLGLGGLAAWLLTKKAESAASPTNETRVTKNGHEWIVRLVPQPPDFVGASNYNVFAPAGSWGPHAELLVVRYSQPVVPNSPKILSGVGQNVPVAMRDAALKDLGIVPPGA